MTRRILPKLRISKIQAQERHAARRFIERYGCVPSKQSMLDMVTQIQGGEAILIDKQSNRVSRYWVDWRGQQVPVVYDKDRKVIVTVLMPEWIVPHQLKTVDLAKKDPTPEEIKTATTEIAAQAKQAREEMGLMIYEHMAQLNQMINEIEVSLNAAKQRMDTLRAHIQYHGVPTEACATDCTNEPVLELTWRHRLAAWLTSW